MDVQKGSGWLNYINGYVDKASDAMDFRVSEHYKDTETNAAWRQTYRLMSKRAPLLTEVYVSMKKLSRMMRTFLADTLCPIIPGKIDLDSEKATRHHRTYKAYLQLGAHKHSADARVAAPMTLAQGLQEQSFLEYCRDNRWDEKARKPKKRTYTTTKCRNCAVGVKFEFELYDNFIGQFASTFFPHTKQMDFLEPIDRGNFHGIAWSDLEYTKHFVGVLCYLIRLHWLPKWPDYVGLSQSIPPDRTDRPPPMTKLFIKAFPFNGFPQRPQDIPGKVHRLRFFFDRGVPRPPSKTINFNEIQLMALDGDRG